MRPVRLDTVQARAIPEGCVLDLRPADAMSRSLAWLIDTVVRGLIWIACLQAAALAGGLGIGLVLVLGFALEWLVPVVFEVLWAGQTPGKKALGLAVLHADGTPVGWQASFIRNAMRFVDFLPLGYAAGFVTTLLAPDGQRLGDLAAGTLVVHVSPPERVTAMPGVGAEPPPVPLLDEERRAIVEYARRASHLTDERAWELAAVAAPLSGTDDPSLARLRLLRIANHLLGEV
ncbi:MAG: RDD family protein [Vicinamibacterales bacterium]